MVTKSYWGDGMNDKQLTTICILAECGSFNKAEDMLFLSKQALMKQVNALEKELGFPLFFRTGKGLVLTPEGEVFIPRAERFLAEMNQTVEICRDMSAEQNRIRISVPRHPKLLLEKAIDVFAQQYPEVCMDISLRNRESPVQIMQAGKADLVECSPREELTGEEYGCYTLPKMPYYGILSTAHPLAVKKDIQLSDLSGYRIGVAKKVRCQELITMLEIHAPNAKIIEESGEEIQFIYNFCLNQGIYISKAVFAKDLPPFRSFPIRPEVAAVNCIYYRKNAGDMVHNFLDVVRNTYREQ